MYQENLFDSVSPDISLEDVFYAYFDCRRHKRGTLNALRFEIDFEESLVKLWREINNGSYQIGRSISFIVDKPVKREIFAADFRDRIVHHLVIGKLMPFFERNFIDASYSCRRGKGTLFGVFDIYKQLKCRTRLWHASCFVLKMDIRSFFMSIRKDILYHLLSAFILRVYTGHDRPLILNLVKMIIFNNPVENCIRKGRKENWIGLGFSKSLFHVPSDRGLPIGNLTSQIFANFYLNIFDQFVLSHPAGFGYGRYVDDFILIHENKETLLSFRKEAEAFLQRHLKLIVHPGKTILQHASKGIPFVGFYIKPGRIVCGRRIKNQAFQKIHYYNLCVNEKRFLPTYEKVCASLNSYLGILKHISCFRLRRRLIERLDLSWKKKMVISGGACKILPVFALRKKFIARRAVKSKRFSHLFRK